MSITFQKARGHTQQIRKQEIQHGVRHAVGNRDTRSKQDYALEPLSTESAVEMRWQFAAAFRAAESFDRIDQD